MADDRNTSNIYAGLQADVDRLSTRNAELYVKLDTLQGELAGIPFRKRDKISQKKAAIRNTEQEIKANERRIANKQDDMKRLQIAGDRMEMKETAYEHGIDPNKAWADAAASGLGSIASITGSLAGAGVLGGSGIAMGEKDPTTPPPPPSKTKMSNTNMLLIGGAALVLLLMMKKK